MRAGRAAFDELGGGDQSVAKRHFFDDVGIVARPAEPLIDHVDEADVVAAIEPGMHQVGSVDVEDHESGWTSLGVAVCHAAIVAEGCYRVVVPAGTGVRPGRG